MHVKKRKIISLFHVGIKVGYLFITRKIVTRSDIGNSYDLVSKTYQQEYLKIMHTYNDILLNHLIKHISKGRILDLAGGTGYNSNFIQEYNDYSIDLVDISKQMLKQCQNSSINKVCKGMLEFLTVQESCCYDAIVCTWALMYEQPQKVLNQCQRLLKNGGYLYILVNDQQTLPQIRKIYPKLLIEYVGSINKLMFDLPMPNNAQQLERWAKKAGLKNCRVTSKKQEFYFTDWNRAAKFVTSTGALAGYDAMLDLKNEKIFNTLVEQLQKFFTKPCITHHFVMGIFKKG